jgi:hypothetical protein
MSLASGMMSQYYGYGGGDNYFPPATVGYRGRVKPVTSSPSQSAYDGC